MKAETLARANKIKKDLDDIAKASRWLNEGKNRTYGVDYINHAMTELSTVKHPIVESYIGSLCNTIGRIIAIAEADLERELESL